MKRFLRMLKKYISNQKEMLLKKCFFFKKTLWFQWHWFTKENQHPTQFIFKLVIFAVVLFFFKSCFVDFNKIPHYNVSIEADKLADYRYVNKANGDNSWFYLHYQIADLKITIPMVSPEYEESFESGVFYGSIRDDSLSMCCKKVAVQAPFLTDTSSQLLLTSEISPYWHAIYDIAARQSGFHPIPSKLLSNKEHERNFYDIRDNYLRIEKSNCSIDTKLKNVRKAIPDSLSEIMQNYYFFRISSNILNTNAYRQSKDALDVKSEYPFEYVFLDDNGKSIFNIWQINSYAVGKETLLNQENNYIELCHANNYTKKMSNDYERLCIFHNCDKSFINDTIGVKFRCYKPNKLVKNPKQYLAIKKPSWGDRHDISRGWYKIFLKTSTIDSLSLTIDFVGATDFYPMNIEPDEKGSNFIKFYNPRKILQIRKNGLTFYAQFKDLENMQTIRCFFVTTIISGLLIALLTSVITGVYHILRKAIRIHSITKNKC